MTDAPSPGPRPTDPDRSLDETQPVEPQRYTPPPAGDPPDARWGAQPTAPSPERWFEPSPSAGSWGQPSERAAGPASGWGTAGSGSAPGRPAEASGWEGTPAAPIPPSGSRWGDPSPTSAATASYAVPASPVQGRGGARRGSSVAPVLAASLLSAALASGGTVFVLDRTGAFDRPATTGSGSGITPAASQSVRLDESSAVIDAAAAVGPAVVRITTEGSAEGFDFGQIPTSGVGSGVIYDASGWIVTNRHVVAGSSSLTVELKDGREFPGRVYGIDTLTDLAIVKIDGEDLQAAAIGSSDGLKVGQQVVAVGSPLGTYSFSVTSGIVSGTGRSITVEGGDRLSNLIQTDAAINPGNSGGPLVDAVGAVVGINTAVAAEANGIGFAIPVDIARPIMEQAVRGEELARPWIGIRFENIDVQLQQDQDLPVAAGALVGAGSTGDAVVSGSPAAQAGIRAGDIITAIEGQAIDAEHPLDALLVQFAPGTAVTLELIRDGEPISVEVTLGTRPADL